MVAQPNFAAAASQPIEIIQFSASPRPLIRTRMSVIYLKYAFYCVEVEPFEMFGEDDSPLRWWISCVNYCDGDCHCGDGPCIADLLIQIQPGGRYRATWRGGFFEKPTPPEECLHLYSCLSQCRIEHQATAGTYRLRSVTSTDADCDWGNCTCEPNEDGWCQMNGVLSGVETAAEAFVDYPAETSAEIVF
jgi:hypothetical protein